MSGKVQEKHHGKIFELAFRVNFLLWISVASQICISSRGKGD